MHHVRAESAAATGGVLFGRCAYEYSAKDFSRDILRVRPSYLAFWSRTLRAPHDGVRQRAARRRRDERADPVRANGAAPC